MAGTLTNGGYADENSQFGEALVVNAQLSITRLESSAVAEMTCSVLEALEGVNMGSGKFFGGHDAGAKQWQTRRLTKTIPASPPSAGISASLLAGSQPFSLIPVSSLAPAMSGRAEYACTSS